MAAAEWQNSRRRLGVPALDRGRPQPVTLDGARKLAPPQAGFAQALRLRRCLGAARVRPAAPHRAGQHVATESTITAVEPPDSTDSLTSSAG